MGPRPLIFPQNPTPNPVQAGPGPSLMPISAQCKIFGGTCVSPLRAHTQVRPYVSSVAFRPQLGMTSTPNLIQGKKSRGGALTAPTIMNYLTLTTAGVAALTTPSS